MGPSLILERSLENLSCMHTKNILRHVRGVVCGVITKKLEKNTNAKKMPDMCSQATTALNRSGPIKPGGERAGLSAQLRPAAQSIGAVAGRGGNQRSSKGRWEAGI